ncbi:MAG TPA: CRTAC1 family protein [Bacteroidetes bacterium]|nr:CRTAC1 family protein [Bacteroidota bacterium]
MFLKKTISHLLFISFALVLGCGGESKNEKAKTPEPPKQAQASGTAKMIALIKEANAKIDPMKVQFASNSRRADLMKGQMEKMTKPSARLSKNLKYAAELLNAGRNEQAIVEFEKLLGLTAQYSLPPNYVYQIKKMLALSYMRLGETENCIKRNNEQSCIIPLKKKATYAIREASESAIKIYSEMLKERPGDGETIWMLNIAYMTIGGYPDEVPPKWRIPESAFKSDYEIPVFTNISSKVGVNTMGLSGGVCVEDFNNDGLLDIVASSWGLNDQIHFFVNRGDGRFDDRTKEAGLEGLTGGLNIRHADFNNDGFVDVLVLRGAWYGADGNLPNSLLKNKGDGTFEDVTIAAGLLSYHPTQAAEWADFNLDGWLDLFVGNESSEGFANDCEFYFNNGDGTFTNKIMDTGLGTYQAYIKGVAAGDINNDGWPDLYINTLTSENKLLLNNGATQTGAVAFSDITSSAGVGRPLVGFPCWMFDFNNDGWQDIFAAGFGVPEGHQAAQLAALNFKERQFAGGAPKLYLNNRDNTFTDFSKKAGLEEDLFVMGSNYGDLDNDGWLDCYLGTGTPAFTSVVPNKMFRNNKGKSFQDVTTAGGFGHIQKGHSVGFGDFDNDGDQDIFCVIGGAMEGDAFGDAFFLNPLGQQSSWVTLQLEGTVSNRSAIGARVGLVVADPKGNQRTVFNTVSTGSSFGGNSLQLETGLGNAVKIIKLEVLWPNREQTKQSFSGLEINKVYKIKEGQAQAVEVALKRFDFAVQ